MFFAFLGFITVGVHAQFAVQFDQSKCPDTPICPTNGFSQNLTLVQATQCKFANFTTSNGTGICHSNQCEFTQVGRPNIPCFNSPCGLEGSPCFCQLPCSCLIQTLTSTFITQCINENRPCEACPNRHGYISGSSCNLIDLKKNAEHVDRSQAFCGADGLCHYQGQNGGSSFTCDEAGVVELVNSSNPEQVIGFFGDNGCSKNGQLAPVGSICECFVQCGCVRQYETGINNSIAQDVAQCVLGTPVPTPFTLAPTPSPTPRPTPVPPTTPAPTPFTTGASCGGVCQLANAGQDVSLTATTCQSFTNILGACETVSFSNQTVICKIIDASFNLVPCPAGTQNPNQCPTQFAGEACSCAAPQGFCGCVIVGILPGLPFTGTCFSTPRPTPVPPPPPTPKPTPLITGTFCPGTCPITETLAGYLATACEQQTIAPGECLLISDVLTCTYFDANFTAHACPQQIGGACQQGQPCTCGMPANSCACIGQRTTGDNAFFTALCSSATPAPTTRPSGVCNKQCALNADNTCQAVDVTFAAATCQKQHCRSSNLIADVDVDCISQECFGNDTFSPEGLPCLQCDCACTNKPQVIIDTDSSSSSASSAKRKRSASSSGSGSGSGSGSDETEIYEYSIDSGGSSNDDSSGRRSSSSSSSSSSSDSDTLVVRDCFTRTTLPATNAHVHVTKKAGARVVDDADSSDEQRRKHRNNGRHNNRRGPCKLCQENEEDNFWFFCDVDECELHYNVWAWVVIGIVVCCCFATCMWAIYFAYNRRVRAVVPVQRMRLVNGDLPATVGIEIPRVLDDK